MRAKSIICIFAFLLAMGILLTGPVLAETANDPWTFSENITLEEKSGNDLTNYQVPVQLDSTNFDFSKAENDGSDLRFLKGEKFLNYWIEDWDSVKKEASIWVKVPFLPANGTTKIQMIYGNPEAESESSGAGTFDFFDDFEGNSLEGFDWKSEAAGEGFVEVRNGVCKLVAPKVHVNDFSMIYSKDSFDINSIFVAKRMKVTTGEDERGPVQRQGFIDQLDNTKNKIWHETELANESKVRWEVTSRKERFRSFDLTDVRVPEGEWYESGVAWYMEEEIPQVAWFKNGVRNSAMDYASIDFVPSLPMHIYLYAASYPDASKNTGYMAVDYVLVRKFVSEAPNVFVGAVPQEAVPEKEEKPAETPDSGEEASQISTVPDSNKSEENISVDSEEAVWPDLDFSGIRLSSPDKFDFPARAKELKAAGTGVIFLSIEPENIWQYERFVKSAHEEGLMVHAVLLEDPGCTSGKDLESSLAAVDEVLDYNRKSLAGFDGINIYIEPSPDSDSGEECMDYVALLEDTADNIEGDIDLSVSIPPRYAVSKIDELAKFIDFFVVRAYDGTEAKLDKTPLIVDEVAPKMGEIRGVGSKGVVEIGIGEGFTDKKQVVETFNSLTDYYSGDAAFLGLSISNYTMYSALPAEVKEEEKEEVPESKPSIPGFEPVFAVLGLGAFSVLRARRK